MFTADELAPKIADFLRDYTRGTLYLEPRTTNTNWFAEIDLLTPLHETSLRERADALFDHLRLITQQELQRYRTMGNLSSELAVTKEQALVNIHRDFEAGNMTLRGWSTLYHRYFAGQPLAAADLANAVFRTESIINRAKKPMYYQLAQTLLASADSPVTPPLGIIARPQIPSIEHTHGFFGREGACQDLIHQLSDPYGAGMIGIEGMGGIGKTALALETIRMLAETGQFGSPTLWIKVRPKVSYWINANQPATTRSSEDQANQNLALILTQLITQLGQRSWLALPPEEQIDLLQTVLAGQPHLIVVDNLETDADAHLIPTRLYPLAESGAARLIITSRYALAFPFLTRMPLKN